MGDGVEQVAVPSYMTGELYTGQGTVRVTGYAQGEVRVTVGDGEPLVLRRSAAERLAHLLLAASVTPRD